MLKYKVAKLEDVAEAYRSMYVERDGAFYLQVEGAVDKTKIDEFRDNNIALTQQLEKFKGVDPVKYAEYMKLQTQLDEKKLIEAGKVDEVVAQRVEAMKAEFVANENALKTSLSLANKSLEVLIVDNSVREAATKVGILPSAVDDVLLRAKQIYSVADGAAVPKNAKGETIFGKDGTSPMPITEWLGGLKEAAPHLFQASQGGGGAGSGQGRPNAGANLSPTQKIAAGLQAQS